MIQSFHQTRPLILMNIWQWYLSSQDAVMYIILTNDNCLYLLNYFPISLLFCVYCFPKHFEIISCWYLSLLFNLSIQFLHQRLDWQKLTFSMRWANSADDKSMAFFFSYFSPGEGMRFNTNLRMSTFKTSQWKIAPESQSYFTNLCFFSWFVFFRSQTYPIK